MTSAALGERPAEPARETIRVPLEGRAYDILVGRGVSGELGAHAAVLGARAVCLVTDEAVYALHAPAAEASLAAAGLRVERVVVPAGESSKSFTQLQTICDAMLAARLERGDLVVALGGGVVGDLAGFAAAIVLRGVRFIQVPTTLLAQVDSSVGGKTGINTARGKNLVGAFHQPALVLADTALLDTLAPRDMRAGYAEVAKYGLINDPGFFAWCEAHWADIFAGGSARDHAVAQSCLAKVAVVLRDEREEGDRALLNLGHTFGHALERAVAYDGARLIHGEGVAVGMALAFRFSVRLGLCPRADSDRVDAHLRSVGLPTLLADVPGGVGTADDLIAAMGQDKKVRAGQLTFILARGIGRSFIAPGIAREEVRAFLEDELARAPS
ncbi:MAG: 3-dehydroquinate synthase [Enterovirga sp.]|nr:3-dehydroquinate synthase [Enterovirga sp.]